MFVTLPGIDTIELGSALGVGASPRAAVAAAVRLAPKTHPEFDKDCRLQQTKQHEEEGDMAGPSRWRQFQGQ